jgi:predicted permease
LLSVDLGFDPERAAIVRVDVRRELEPEARASLLYEFVDRTRGVPGVTAAGLSDAVPMDVDRTWAVRRPDQQPRPGESQAAYVRRVSAGYLDAMSIAMLRGRDFDSRDSRDGQPAVIINETLAHQLYADADPVGRTVISIDSEWTIIGVVEDVRHAGPDMPPGPEIYFHVTQTTPSSADLVIRSPLPVDALRAGVAAALHAVDPRLPMTDFRPAATLVSRAVSSRRFLLSLVGAFAGLALTLATIGIYGVVSHAVGQRTQEIGIRMALGASAGRVQRGIVGWTLALAATGIATGFAAALAIGPAFAPLLYGISPRDPVTFGAIAALLMGVAGAASYLPARRAARIEPLTALRV